MILQVILTSIYFTGNVQVPMYFVMVKRRRFVDLWASGGRNIRREMAAFLNCKERATDMLFWRT